MPDDAPLIRSLRAAVAAAPADMPLRLHLAELLLDAGQGDAAVAEAAVALTHAPGDPEARALMVRAMGGGPAPQAPAARAAGDGPPPRAPAGFDWRAAEREVKDVLPPRFAPTAVAADGASTVATGGASPVATAGASPAAPGNASPAAAGTAPAGAADSAPGSATADATEGAPTDATERVRGGTADATYGNTPVTAADSAPPFLERPLGSDGGGDPGDAPAFDIETPALRLADVGGMQDVKDRLEAAFLAPMRNPALRKLFGKSLRGGLLLYGPPGCGKTFIARAIAGELGASFMSVSLSDVLDMYIGQSEKNVHEVFRAARAKAPCVVFLDELDALGAKRSRSHHSGLRNAVNQLLVELDGADGDNEGVFVLAATNTPWDVDVALRRPGRLDRTLLVLPPDEAARAAILRYHLRERPIDSVDLAKLTRATDGFSGADLAHVCESAAETALMDSVRTGTVRMINTTDLLGAAKQLKPSTDAWFASARNVALFANDGGTYDDLLAHLKKKRKL